MIHRPTKQLVFFLVAAAIGVMVDCSVAQAGLIVGAGELESSRALSVGELIELFDDEPPAYEVLRERTSQSGLAGSSINGASIFSVGPGALRLGKIVLQSPAVEFVSPVRVLRPLTPDFDGLIKPPQA